MDTATKGQIAEQKVILRALEKGYVVSRPIQDARYDLIVDDGTKLHKVQVKYGDGKSSHSEGAVAVYLRCRDSNKDRGKGKKGLYESSVDMILVYMPKTDSVLKLPDEYLSKPAITIRYDQPKNGQKHCTNLAQDMVW